jgi:hypothetical protein
MPSKAKTFGNGHHVTIHKVVTNVSANVIAKTSFT